MLRPLQHNAEEFGIAGGILEGPQGQTLNTTVVEDGSFRDPVCAYVLWGH